MKLFKIHVIDKETKKVEAIVGNEVDDYHAEKLLNDTAKLIDIEKYEVKAIPC